MSQKIFPLAQKFPHSKTFVFMPGKLLYENILVYELIFFNVVPLNFSLILQRAIFICALILNYSFIGNTRFTQTIHGSSANCSVACVVAT